LSKNAKTLTVTIKVTNLRKPSASLSKLPAAKFLEYVTRWQMGNTLYFAGMSTSGGSPSFYAGKTGSLDLCSVSACFPHVLVYPEAGASPTGTSTPQSGRVKCPKKPSAAHPCTIKIVVKAAAVGKPTAHRLLQEVGSYSWATSIPQSSETNASAQKDITPLEIDGVCCFNFQAARSSRTRHHHAHHQRGSHHLRGFTG
ncbi:MAG TPA: hypothetical protein VE983_10550, partial [Solirubrobacteraceae bacterium]|nr:hypothetical protein [Solirubrobacteraceae bacterium]